MSENRTKRGVVLLRRFAGITGLAKAIRIPKPKHTGEDFPIFYRFGWGVPPGIQGVAPRQENRWEQEGTEEKPPHRRHGEAWLPLLAGGEFAGSAAG